MFTKLKHNLTNFKNRAEEFVKLTKIAINIGRALNSKILKYDVINEFIYETSNSLGIILLGVLVNNITSGNLNTALNVLVAIFLNSVVSDYIENYINYKMQFLENLREIDTNKFLLKKISRIPVKYRSTPEFKEIEKTANINEVYRFFESYISLITRVYGTILTLSALTIIQPYIFALALVVGLISLYLDSKSKLLFFNTRKEKSYFSQLQNVYISNFNLRNIEDLTDNVKINNNYNFLEKKYDKFIENYKEWFYNFTRTVSGRNMFSKNILSTGTAFSVATAYYYGINGVIPVGNLLIFRSAYSNLMSSIGFFSVNIARMLELYLSVKAVDDLINFKVPETKYLPIPNLNHLEIEFQNVSFSYPGTENKVLKNISFKISHKDKLGIIGENGAGKSTLIKLIFRIYTPTSGQILVNGVNLNDIADEDYYQLFSVLGQASIPENAMTVEDMIYLGDTSKAINKKKIMDAAKLSTFHKDVVKLQDGYKQLIANNYSVGVFNKYSEKKYTSLSGGQYRKLLLSKVFYGQKPIIVLDEPTDSIDPNSAFTIFKNLNELKHNQITIFITHDVQRMQLVANKVLVLKDGEVVEFDETNKLLKSKNSYLNQALKTYLQTIRD